MQFVLIRDESAGNESVGEMWQETKVFDGSTTLEEAMRWALHPNFDRPSRKRVTITKPHC